jgi:hypothetical protein
MLPYFTNGLAYGSFQRYATRSFDSICYPTVLSACLLSLIDPCCSIDFNRRGSESHHANCRSAGESFRKVVKWLGWGFRFSYGDIRL